MFNMNCLSLFIFSLFWKKEEGGERDIIFVVQSWLQTQKGSLMLVIINIMCEHIKITFRKSMINCNVRKYDIVICDISWC
jgi:hypothetical protein